MKVFLIRHGESISDVKGKYDGDYDDLLSDKGNNEARILAKKLLNKDIEIIFSSSKIRAKETSEILKSAWECDLVVTENFNERDIYGAFPELSKDKPEEEYRRLGEVMKNRDALISGVETYSDFKKRIIKYFLKIMKSDYDAVAIVTHGGPIRCIFRDLLKIGEFKSIENGAVIEIENNNLDYKVVKIDGATI